MGIFFSARFALADYFSSRDLDLAIRLAPSNPDLLLLRGNPADLERAVQLAPASAKPLIALALHRERSGNAAGAERLLLEAAARDLTHGPKWALANFYFRQNRMDDFWRWARASTANYHGDLSALFRLGLNAEPDPKTVFARLVPDRHPARRQFVEVALSLGRVSENTFAAEALARDRDRRDRDLLLSYCDGLLDRGDGSGAALLARALPDASEAGRCFGWREAPAEGVAAVPRAAALTVTLNGMQADPAVVARRWIAVSPGRVHRLSYRTQPALAPRSGYLRWRVGSDVSDPVMAAGDMLFRAPPGASAIMLELVSRRETGLAKPEGRIVLEEAMVRAE